MSPPAHSPSDHSSTHTYDVFLAASGSRSVGIARRGSCGFTRPKPPDNEGNESPEFVVMADGHCYMAVGQPPDVVAMRYSHASPDIAQVA
jgi:hypothetical protein